MRPLTYILLFVMLTCLFTVVGAAQIKGQTIELSAEEVKACEAEGECRLITGKAYGVLIGELERLYRVIAAMKKEQCA